MRERWARAGPKHGKIPGATHEIIQPEEKHIIISPGGLLATGPHADLRCSIATNEVDGDLAQDGQIASCRSIPDPAVILAERDIKDPMEPIFNRPMTTASPDEYLGVITAA